MPKLPDVTAQAWNTPKSPQGVAQLPSGTGMEGVPAEASAAMGAQMSQVGAQIQNQVDETTVNDTYANKFSPEFRQLYQQYYTLQGKDALDAMPKFQEKMQALRNQTAQEMGSNQAKNLFLQLSNRRIESEQDAMVRYADNQYKGYKEQVHLSTLTNYINQASDKSGADDVSEHAFGTAIGSGLAQIDRYAMENGKPPEWARAQASKFTSSAVVGRISNALANNDPLGAQEIYKRYGSEIDETQRLTVQHRVQEGAMIATTSSTANAWVDDALAGLGSQKQRNPTQPQGTGDGSQAGGSRAARNNNPGNIQKSNVTWDGEVPGDDSRFVSFATPEAGMAAMQKNLLAYQDKHGLNTVQGIISRWAPASENGEQSTTNYINTVAAAAGVKPGDKIDLHDPATMQKITAAMAQVESGGNQSAVFHSGQPLPPDTSGMPNSRDVRATLPMLLAKVEPAATALYGADTSNPARIEYVQKLTSALTGRVAREVTQLDAVQRQSQGDLIDFIAGHNGGAPVTDLAQIQSDPKMQRNWQLLDPQAKLGLENLVYHNAVGGKGNDAMYWDVWKRIHADPESADKIDFYQQILPFAGVGKLNVQQIGQLRQEIDRNETPGGRSVNQLMKSSAQNVSTYFKTNPLFTAQPNLQIAATMKWTEDAGKKIDEYVKAGKSTRSLFMVDTPDSIIKPDYLQTYVNSTPAQGLAEQAARLKTGQGFTPEQVASMPQLPATIKTRADADAWINALPPNVTAIRDENGTPRLIRQKKAAH